MKKSATQTINGKAFEYALLHEFQGKLQKVTTVQVIENEPFQKAKECFYVINEKEQSRNLLVASAAVNFLIDIEPRLSYGLSSNDILQLEIMPDKKGQEGDVRDVLAIRSLQKWQIGVSAKNNHRAVKHSRLSKDLDFGEKWVGLPNSKTYFSDILPVFTLLEDTLKQNKNATWKSIGNKSDVIYVPLLNAFKNELEKLSAEHPNVLAQNLVKYLIGSEDFYKVIKGKKKVEVQAFNLYGTLNQPLNQYKPKGPISKVKLPDRLIDVTFKKNSKTTLLITLNQGWQFSCRIHSAKTTVESSLKFDINLVSTPQSLFSNHLLIP